ncbi:hypothetical protein [Opitutus sp. ER46]|uniref:hypothetical protein n=1 Tax=Opitutus sp. ER46 TaxID=2161864 RepID=UPI001E429AA1|nr:hypothetical protein [Opitutus sp. ER46]
MRWLSALFVSVLLTASTFAADSALVRVWPRWVNAEDFDRIGQYFGQSESDRRELVLRTHAEERAGLYFLVRLKGEASAPAAQIVVEVIRPDAPEPKRFTFPVTLSAKRRVVEVGLTGADWPGGRDAHPVAWKLSLLDAAGNVLASEQSFLWASPTK